VHGALSARAAAHHGAGLLSAGVVSDRDDVLRVPGQRHERWQRSAAGRIKGGVDAVGRELPDAPLEPIAVGGRLSAKRAQVVVVVRAGRADHPRATLARELHGRAAHRAGGAVDQHRGAGAHAQQIQRARRGLDRHG
jgi:hypothetical protein